MCCFLLDLLSDLAPHLRLAAANEYARTCSLKLLNVFCKKMKNFGAKARLKLVQTLFRYVEVCAIFVPITCTCVA